MNPVGSQRKTYKNKWKIDLFKIKSFLIFEISHNKANTSTLMLKFSFFTALFTANFPLGLKY
jgi:hypothetical protein